MMVGGAAKGQNLRFCSVTVVPYFIVCVKFSLDLRISCSK